MTTEPEHVESTPGPLSVPNATLVIMDISEEEGRLWDEIAGLTEEHAR